VHLYVHSSTLDVVRPPQLGPGVSRDGSKDECVSHRRAEASGGVGAVIPTASWCSLQEGDLVPLSVTATCPGAPGGVADSAEQAGSCAVRVGDAEGLVIDHLAYPPRNSEGLAV
jgi:hypothetical protein